MKKRSLLIMGLVICLIFLPSLNQAKAQDMLGANRAYKDLVDSLVKKYGLSENSLDLNNIPKGFYHAELVDLKGDGKQELVLVYNPLGGTYSIVCEIWDYQGGKANLIYSNLQDNDDISIGYPPFINAGGNSGEIGYFNTDSGKNFYLRHYMGTGASNSILDKIFTWENGTFKETYYEAENKYDEGDDVYYYRINDEIVSKDQFNSKYNKYKNRNVIYSHFEENYRKEKFYYDKFLKELNQKLPVQKAKIYLNNKKLDEDAVIIGGNSLVPIRSLMEPTGAKLIWNQIDKSLEIKRLDKTILMKIASNEIKVNGQMHKIDQPAQLIDSKTYVPVRFIAESFGYDVKWDNKNKIININSK